MIKLSFLNLFRRKTRTFLSVAGIALGVAAIIVLVALVDGFTADFNEVIGGFRAISVVEKDSQDHVLSRIDSSFWEKLEALPNVKVAVPEIWVLPEKVDGKVTRITPLSTVSVYGLDTDKFFSSGASGWIGRVEKGSALRSQDKGEVLIGKKVAEDFHKFVGSTIKINDTKFRVKGILETESELVQSIVVMNLGDAEDLSALPKGKVNSFTVLLADPNLDQQTGKLIGLKYSEELTVFTQADFSEQFSSITDNLRLLAIAVALISALVGGIGIANTILMSVFERFKEIGALKSVGWTNSNVVRMVLYESAFLGLIGGLAGIALAFTVLELMSSGIGVRYLVSMPLLFWSFAFAVLLGLVAGTYPAFRASRLSPVDALRS